jgi:hypothetical protein
MLLNRGWYESGDARHGDWSRDELEAMDSKFCEAMERAFARGLERRESATATFRTRKSREATIEAAIEAGWRFCCDEDFDVPFAAAVARVRVLLPTITAARVRLGFEQRFAANPRVKFGG